MKVCILQTVLDPYKGANHLPLFAAMSDVEFTVVCNRSKVDTADLPSNVSVVTVPAKTGSYYYGFADFFFAYRVLKVYPESGGFWKQFDVIHLNQVMGPALKKLKTTCVPMLFFIHHPVTADRDISVQESSFLEGLQWKLKYALLIRWQQAMCTVADTIATVSQAMSKRISVEYGIDFARISVVLNGVDTAIFTPVADTDFTFDVISAGSFVHPRKGFRYLRDVYTKLSLAGFTVADVGRRTEQQAEQLQKIAGVTCHGTVEGSQLVDLMRHSRVLVSTSLFEGFGLSLIEALACGHPAFAFDVGAVPEVLGKVDASLTVPVRNTEAMVQSIVSYLENSVDEKIRLGKAYRKAVQKHFSLDQSAAALQDVYINLVSQG